MSNETAILAIISGLLFVIALCLVALLRKQWTNQVDVQLSAGIDEAITRLGQATQHYVDVNAVVAMVRQLDEHPDALELIKSYPESVRAAAWLHCINTLGSSLQEAQSQLAQKNKMRGQFGGTWEGDVKRAQRYVDDIRAKLDAAVSASGHSGIRSV